MPDDTHKILIEEEPVHIVIDSGAPCNIINSEIVMRLKTRGLELQNCKRVIHSYNSPPIVTGQCVSVGVQAAEKNSGDYSGIPCHSRNRAATTRQIDSRINRLFYISVYNIHENEQHSASYNWILNQYLGLCDDIGKLRNSEVSLHTDHTILPSAHRISLTRRTCHYWKCHQPDWMGFANSCCAKT